MQLIINEYGAFVGKKANRFEVKRDDTVDEFPADDVEQIVIAKASSISSGAVKLAMEKNIDIVFLGKFGMPAGRIYPCKLGGTTLTRRIQLEASADERGFGVSSKLVQAKIRNQAYFLKSLGKTRGGIPVFSNTADEMLSSSSSIDAIDGNLKDKRDTIFGIEGSAAAKYFECLQTILPFNGREHKAEDPVNALLNYGYGILYSEVERACILAGLDPYLGFLHADRYGKPSMVLDMIEEFRAPIVDRAVVTLYTQKQLDIAADFEVINEEFRISQQGRRKIIDAVMSRLSAEITFEGCKTTFQDIILKQCRSIVSSLLEQKEFKAFTYKW